MPIFIYTVKLSIIRAYLLSATYQEIRNKLGYEIQILLAGIVTGSAWYERQTSLVISGYETSEEVDVVGGGLNYAS